MTTITSDAQLRTILRDAINANGVHIPLSQRAEQGLEHFKATNGTLFTILTLSSDLATIHAKTNIRPVAPLLQISETDRLLLDKEEHQDIEPTEESVLKYFANTLLAFKYHSNR